MGESVHVRINLPDRSYQASARSGIRKIAESVGFADHRLGEVEIIIAEITSNLIKHAAKGGYLLVRGITDEQGIEIIAIDEGPGMKIPAEMMKDGRSTTRTLGHGLGAIKRLSNVFDLYSLPGWGTILLSRTFIDKNKDTKKKSGFQIAGLNVCKPGEQVSGDSWKFSQIGRKIRGILVDGLGHGQAAHEAAETAIKTFSRLPGATPVDQLYTIHQDLKSLRGAVINVVYIDMVNHQLRYCGVGNISMKVFSHQQSKGCFSYNGIVGHIMPSTINNHSLQWMDTDMLMMHSDGISSRWDLQKYPGIAQHDPLIFCSALYKDHNRGSDDATVVFGKMVKVK